MTKSFLTGNSNSAPIEQTIPEPVPTPSTEQEPISACSGQKPNREPLKILIIGSRRGVVGTIRSLYRLGFAEVGEWSPLLPAPNSGEVMSILTRSIPVN